MVDSAMPQKMFWILCTVPDSIFEVLKDLKIDLCSAITSPIDRKSSWLRGKLDGVPKSFFPFFFDTMIIVHVIIKFFHGLNTCIRAQRL